jgi:hypothetical protein
VDDEKDCEQRKRTYRVNDGEHADTPSPRCDFENSGGQVTTDPCIDLFADVRDVLILVQKRRLTINGRAGMYENNRRERVEVKSAIRTSTSSMIQVYPIYIRQKISSTCAGPTYLVDYSSGAETLYVFRACFDNRTDRVEDNGDNDEFNSAKDIGNLCSGRLNFR